MIWVTWRQHRAQAIAMLALLAFTAVYGIAIGLWMRSAFDADGLPACLARSGGADCGPTIASFFSRFSRGASVPLNVLPLIIPGFLGAVVGAPLLGAELERGTWQLAWSQTVPRGRWLAAKLGLVIGGLVVFGAATSALLTWAKSSRSIKSCGTRSLPRLTTRCGAIPTGSTTFPCCSRAMRSGLLRTSGIGPGPKQLSGRFPMRSIPAWCLRRMTRSSRDISG